MTLLCDFGRYPLLAFSAFLLLREDMLRRDKMKAAGCRLKSCDGELGETEYVWIGGRETNKHSVREEGRMSPLRFAA